MQSLMQDGTKPHGRAADPPEFAQTQREPTEGLSASGILSSNYSPLKINIFHQQRHKGVRLCMSNCRSIDVTVLIPLYADSESYFPISDIDPGSSSLSCGKEAVEEELRDEMKMQGHKADLSPTLNSTTTTIEEASHDNLMCLSNISSKFEESSSSQTRPRFLDLPLEIRLKIYKYILPPRHHTIATQIPHNGFFYNTATIPQHSAQSFYPFGTQPPRNQKLTTYKILSSNFRPNYPLPSIYPEILRVCKQIHAEAEPLLYGEKDTLFDFGTHLDACHAFWGDRSQVARESVRSLRIAREVPTWLGRDVYGNYQVDNPWVKFCNFIQTELTGLRNLDLTLWTTTGSVAIFPSGTNNEDESENLDERENTAREQEQNKQWREWDYTASLLQAEGLKEARVTWWGFNNENENAVERLSTDDGFQTSNYSGKEFDSWVAGRMVGDVLVRDRMIKDGIVLEGVVVLRGSV